MTRYQICVSESNRIPFAKVFPIFVMHFDGSCQTNGPNGTKQKGQTKGQTKGKSGREGGGGRKIKYAGNVSVLVVSNPSINIYNPPRKTECGEGRTTNETVATTHPEEGEEEEEAAARQTKNGVEEEEEPQKDMKIK